MKAGPVHLAADGDHVLDPRTYGAHVLDDREEVGLAVLRRQHPGHRLRDLGQALDLVLPVAVDEHDRDGPDLLTGEVDGHELGPVGQLDHHPVERLDTQIDQPDGQAFGVLARLGVGEARLPVDEGFLVRMDVGSPVEEIPESQPAPPPAAQVVLGVILPVRRRAFQQLEHALLLPRSDDAGQTAQPVSTPSRTASAIRPGSRALPVT